MFFFLTQNNFSHTGKGATQPTNDWRYRERGKGYTTGAVVTRAPACTRWALQTPSVDRAAIISRSLKTMPSPSFFLWCCAGHPFCMVYVFYRLAVALQSAMLHWFFAYTFVGFLFPWSLVWVSESISEVYDAQFTLEYMIMKDEIAVNAAMAKEPALRRILTYFYVFFHTTLYALCFTLDCYLDGWSFLHDWSEACQSLAATLLMCVVIVDRCNTISWHIREEISSLKKRAASDRRYT
jgi:hypothetical protein